MEDLIYRPVFLQVSRLLADVSEGGVICGDASFLSSLPASLTLPALVALFFSLSSFASSPRILPEGGLISAGSPGLCLRLEGRTLVEGGTWEAQGWIGRGSLCCRFELGLSDRLFLRQGEGRERRIVLPEGGSSSYADLDAAECLREGRESRILSPGLKARVTGFLSESAV